MQPMHAHIYIMLYIISKWNVRTDHTYKGYNYYRTHLYLRVFKILNIISHEKKRVISTLYSQ